MGVVVLVIVLVLVWVLSMIVLIKCFTRKEIDNQVQNNADVRDNPHKIAIDCFGGCDNGGGGGNCQPIGKQVRLMFDFNHAFSNHCDIRSYIFIFS